MRKASLKDLKTFDLSVTVTLPLASEMDLSLLKFQMTPKWSEAFRARVNTVAFGFIPGKRLLDKYADKWLSVSSGGRTPEERLPERRRVFTVYYGIKSFHAKSTIKGSLDVSSLKAPSIAAISASSSAKGTPSRVSEELP